MQAHMTLWEELRRGWEVRRRHNPLNEIAIPVIQMPREMFDPTPPPAPLTLPLVWVERPVTMLLPSRRIVMMRHPAAESVPPSQEIPVTVFVQLLENMLAAERARPPKRRGSPRTR